MALTIDNFKCGLCHSSHKNLLEFLDHKIHHVNMEHSFKCFFCEENYFDAISIINHLQEKHLINIETEVKILKDKSLCAEVNSPNKLPFLAMVPFKKIGENSEKLFCKCNVMIEAENASCDSTSHQYSNNLLMSIPGQDENIKQPLNSNKVNLSSPEMLQPLTSVLTHTNANWAIDNVMSSEKYVLNNLQSLENRKLFTRVNNLIQSNETLAESYTSLTGKNSKLNAEKGQKINKMLNVHSNQTRDSKTLLASNTSTTSKNCAHMKEQNCDKNSLVLKEDVEPENLDFYFLLGNMDIKGSSLTYQRTEFRCLHCTFSTSWRPSLIKHMKLSHKDILEIHAFLEIRKINIPEEKVISGDPKLRDYRVMRMSHFIAGNQQLKSLKKRVRKIERQDIPGKYHCPLCHKVFGRLRYMRRHLLTHQEERTHLCDYCGKSFKTKTILLSHRRTHKSKNYHCPQCMFVSSNSAAIHIHRQIHPNGSVICEVCGCAYIDKSTLNKHMKVHDLNRPFPCTHLGCTWRFKTDVMRRAHVRTHTTVGQFSCSHCGYIFRQKHHLQRHITKLHQGIQIRNATLDTPETSKVSHLTPSIDNISEGSEMLLETDGHHDTSKKSSTHISDLLTPHCGLVTNTEILSPSSNEILCSITDTNSFVSSFVDTEPTMIEVFVGDNLDGTISELAEEEKIMSNDLDCTSLEYITETGELVQLLSSDHTYLVRDQFGNLVPYKLPNETSQQIYLLGIQNPREEGELDQTDTISTSL